MQKTMLAGFLAAVIVLLSTFVYSQSKTAVSYLERGDKFHTQGDLERAIVDYTIAI